MTFTLDISDQTFAVSTGSALHPDGTSITSMPLGVAMACSGAHAFANLDVQRTPFVFVDAFAVGGPAGAKGNASPWESMQVIELNATGDCAWIAPKHAPATPMNEAGDFLIQLAFKP